MCRPSGPSRWYILAHGRKRILSIFGSCSPRDPTHLLSVHCFIPSACTCWAAAMCLVPVARPVVWGEQTNMAPVLTSLPRGQGRQHVPACHCSIAGRKGDGPREGGGRLNLQDSVRPRDETGTPGVWTAQVRRSLPWLGRCCCSQWGSGSQRVDRKAWRPVTGGTQDTEGESDLRRVWVSLCPPRDGIGWGHGDAI